MNGGLSNRTKGTLCLIASAFGFAMMGMFVRLTDDLGGPISCFQKGFFRNAVAVVIAAGLFWSRDLKGRASGRLQHQDSRFSKISSPTHLPTSSPSHHSLFSIFHSPFYILLLRSVLGTAGIFLNFYAISHIPLADAMMLNKLAPFFTVAFSWVFLGERLRLAQGACLAGALLGAACVVKPGFAAAALFPALCGFAGGISAGGAYACVHALGRRQVDPRLIVLFFSAFSCLAAVPFMVADFAPMTLPQIGALVGAGATAAMGQFGVTAAYRFAEPRSIAAWDYTNILFAALFGLLLFEQVPDALSVIGFVAIVVSALMLRKA